MPSDDRFGSAFSLLLDDGTEVWPVRMTDVDTGRTAFRVSPGGNTKVDSIEVDDEEALVIYVFQRGFRVRCSSRDGSVTGLYSATHGRNVIEVRRHGS